LTYDISRNDVLSYNRHTQVDEDDSDEINVEDCDGDKDKSIDVEIFFFINLYNTNV
jgi:hypothetical protein